MKFTQFLLAFALNLLTVAPAVFVGVRLGIHPLIKLMMSKKDGEK